MGQCLSQCWVRKSHKLVFQHLAQLPLCVHMGVMTILRSTL